MVIAYAIAGRIDIDFERDPLGYSYGNGSPVFLSQIWPSRKEVLEAEHGLVIPAIFRQVPTRLAFGTKEWSALKVPQAKEEGLFAWNDNSTYIRTPNYITEMMERKSRPKLVGLRCLLKLDDDVRYNGGCCR